MDKESRESYDCQLRRTQAARMLESPEQLQWLSISRQEVHTIHALFEICFYNI